MRITLVLSLLCLAGAASLTAQVPVMHDVQPDSGKIGSVLRVHGFFLGKARVDEVYLTDHTFDMKVKVLEQGPKVIKFRVPPFAKPGRMQLLMLMKPEKEGSDPKLLELPAYLLIEDAQEITQVQPPPAKGKKVKQEPQKDQEKQ